MEWFVATLRRMGHSSHLFNTSAWHPVDYPWMRERLLEVVRGRGYDVVIILTSLEEFTPDVLDELKRHTVSVAWNSDDDWRWDDYTSRLCPHFTYMVTTYRHIYEENRPHHPNLLLSQWACVGTYDGFETLKDIPVSFVGKRYGARAEQIRALRKEGRVVAYGTGFGGAEGDSGGLKWPLRRWVASRFRLELVEQPLAFPAINEIWNRTRISFTPLEASTGDGRLQIKSRAFDMGMSGTLMLCNRNPALEEFYEPGVEYEDYADMEECRDKVRFYLRNESARRRIARAYYERTRKQHLWKHRFAKLFQEIGIMAEVT